MALTLSQYVQKYGPDALAAQAKTGVDAATMLAISFNEGGADPTTIAGGPAGAFFGVKSSSSQPSGDKGTVSVPTREVIGGASVVVQGVFNAYSSFASAASGFVQFLQDNSRYAGALRVANNPAAFIQGLGSAGYATDPTWVSKIQSLQRQIAGQLGTVSSSPTPSTSDTSGATTGLPGVTNPTGPADITGVVPGTTQVPGQTTVTGTAGGAGGSSGGSGASSSSSPTFSDSLLHLLVTIGLVVAAIVLAILGAMFMTGHEVEQQVEEHPEAARAAAEVAA